MGHYVERTINGRRYAYEEESYRIPGVKNPRKRSRYIGPVDAPDVDPVTGKKRKKGLLGKIHEAVRVKQPWEPTREQEGERLEQASAERRLQERLNDMISKPMSVGQIRYVADMQAAMRGAPKEIAEAEKKAAPEPEAEPKMQVSEPSAPTPAPAEISPDAPLPTEP